MRYILKSGRFGTYFYDSYEDEEVDLYQVLELINKASDLLRKNKDLERELKIYKDSLEEFKKKYFEMVEKNSVQAGEEER